MLQNTISYLSNIFDGNSKSYIYIWHSSKFRICYVGQTNGVMGVLGRAYQHLNPNGMSNTLRKRFEQEEGIKLEEVNDFFLFSYCLPTIAEFLSIESSYREAVEYLVQYQLIEMRTALPYHLKFKIISQVRTNDRVTSSNLRNIADYISSHFTQQILGIPPKC